MKKKIIVRISNEIGNQLFMYASSYALSKKLNRLLYLDNETAFTSRKNISTYGLNNFMISGIIASKKDKFLGVIGYLKRKILKKINLILSKKIFYEEPKNKKKITKYSDQIFKMNFSNNLYVEGYFETEKYFDDFRENILKEFSFLDVDKYIKSPFYNYLNEKNSVSVCLRQNRYIEGRNKNNKVNQEKSDNFKLEQIKFINKSIKYIENNVPKPKFYLWSNDFDNIDMSLFSSDVTKIKHSTDILSGIDKRSLDLFLISQCNHHIVIPSSFNWWGAWLSQKKNKIICRPNDDFFTDFKVNNLDFWPPSWKEIS